MTPYLATPSRRHPSSSVAGTRAESEVNQMCHTAANGEDDTGNSSKNPEKVSDEKAAI
ncbi:MAG: hypothetical protein F6K56_05210 [Moorea sp. SIO3G5]|nr:hypothetical protein [Moorena sp. SIO3G5]